MIRKKSMISIFALGLLFSSFQTTINAGQENKRLIALENQETERNIGTNEPTDQEILGMVQMQTITITYFLAQIIEQSATQANNNNKELAEILNLSLSIVHSSSEIAQQDIAQALSFVIELNNLLAKYLEQNLQTASFAAAQKEMIDFLQNPPATEVILNDTLTQTTDLINTLYEQNKIDFPSQTEMQKFIEMLTTGMAQEPMPSDGQDGTEKNDINITDLYSKTLEHSEYINYSLQQLEQILLNGKIKFNEKKASKLEILQEIRTIKDKIEAIKLEYSDLYHGQATIVGSLYNEAMMNYLISILQNDITTLTTQDFMKAFNNDTLQEKVTTYQQAQADGSLTEIMALLEKNSATLKVLETATYEVGLTRFNKMFRYLQDEKMSWTGKSILTTISESSFYAGLAALAYCAAVYITPNNYPVGFMTKEGAESTDDANTDGNDSLYHTIFNTSDLPFRNWIGSIHSVHNYTNAHNPVDKAKFIAEFGALGHIDISLRNYSSSPLLVPVATLLASNAKPTYDYIKETGSNAYRKMINYLRGEIDTPKNEQRLIQGADVPKVYFKDFVGGQALEQEALQIADYIKNPLKYNRTGAKPRVGYVLAGPSQTGKSFFAQALKTLIDETVGDGSNEKVKFIYVTQDVVRWVGGVNPIFEYARQNAPFILFFDEIDMLNLHRDKDGKMTSDILTTMSGLSADPSKPVIVIAATNRPEELDTSLMQDGRLGKQPIYFDYPNYNHRKEYLVKTLQKQNIKLDKDFIDAIAQETDKATFNTLSKIVSSAILFAMQEHKPVNQSHFELSIDKNFRHITENSTITSEEKEIVAIYQAGQAVARHLLHTIKEVVKITIQNVDKPVKTKNGFSFNADQRDNVSINNQLLPANQIKPYLMGHVFTQSTVSNPDLLSDADRQQELLALLAGQAALELIKGQTFSAFGQEDRAFIMDTIEKNIAQGAAISDSIRQQVRAEKDVLYNKIKDILHDHIDAINNIVAILLRKNSIDKATWNALVKKYL